MIEINLEKIKKILEKEPAFLEIDPGTRNIIITGDLHSDFEAATTLIKMIQSNKNTIFVFLGDYVDRQRKEGDGIQTINNIFKMKITYPDRVYLLRGNHELKEINENYGFKDDVLALYDEKTWKAFNDVFNEMPLALRTTTGAIMMHGGLPDISSYEEMKRLQKITRALENKIADQIVWNDCLPRKRAILSRADRGIQNTFTYGQDYFEEKMKILKSKVLIRGHQPEVKGAMFNGKCITLITCKFFEKFPYTNSKYYKLLTPPLQGRPIAEILPLKNEIKFHNV